MLANRLSEDPGVKVLLLEAGGRDWHPFIHMPAGLAKLVGKKGVNWDYDTAPEPNLGHRRLWWPRGKVGRCRPAAGTGTPCCPTSSVPKATAAVRTRCTAATAAVCLRSAPPQSAVAGLHRRREPARHRKQPRFQRPAAGEASACTRGHPARWRALLRGGGLPRSGRPRPNLRVQTGAGRARELRRPTRDPVCTTSATASRRGPAPRAK